jgi:hypothetical protein
MGLLNGGAVCICFFLFPFPNFEIFEQFSRYAILYILHIFNNNMAETRNSEAAAKQRRVI